MRVITPGRAMARWPVGARGACRNCGLVGEVEEGDEVRVARAAGEVRVACPNCGTEIAIPRPAS